jgi:hypothetical protein
VLDDILSYRTKFGASVLGEVRLQFGKNLDDFLSTL